MSTKLKFLTGVTNAMLDKEIKDLKGIVANAHERAQVIAVAVIEHDREHGDCSRAKALVNAIANREERNFMVQFLAFFGAIGCKMEKGVCTGVGHIDVKAKNYHKPDLTGAKNNLWFEAYNAAGEKAHWFQGPPKPAYIPGTLGDVGQNVLNFADRLTKNLDATKDNGRGEQVPIYDLSDDDRKEMSVALDAIRKIGRRVMAREMLETANSVIEETAGIFNLGANPTDEVVSEEPVKEAAAS
jgi:hypothetical protein